MVNYKLAFNELQRYAEELGLLTLQFEDKEMIQTLISIYPNAKPVQYLQFFKDDIKVLSVYYDENGIVSGGTYHCYEVFNFENYPKRATSDEEMIELTKIEIDKLANNHE